MDLRTAPIPALADLSRIARWAVELVGVDYCYIFLLDEMQKNVPPVAHANSRLVEGEEIQLVIDTAQAVAYLTHHRGPSYIANTRGSAEATFLTTILGQVGCRAGSLVPIVDNGHVQGCLVACWAGACKFEDRELDLLLAFSRAASLALQQSRWSQETQRLRREVASLQTIISSLAQGEALEMVLNAIIEQATRLTNAEDALVLLLTEKREWFRVCARRGPGSMRLKAERITVEHSLNGLVIATGEPLVSHDVPSDPRADQERVSLLGVQSVVIVPMTICGQVIGTIAVHNKRGGPFDESDVETLRSFADQAALAIENARLMNELAKAQREIRKRHEELQHLLGRTLEMQEEERRRIAVDIHDQVLQLIIGAGYEIQAARSCCLSDPQRAREGLVLAENLLSQATAEMRQAIYGLWPATLDEVGLVPALRELLDHLRKMAGVECELKVSGEPRCLMPAAQIAAYRIVQEGLQNIERHAEAGSVHLAVRFGLRNVRIVIEDDGRGFNPERVAITSRGHLGLLGMQERARRVGGGLEIASRPGHGCKITLELPIDEGAVQWDSEVTSTEYSLGSNYDRHSRADC